jgi:hypothetical protein
LRVEKYYNPLVAERESVSPMTKTSKVFSGRQLSMFTSYEGNDLIV